MQLTTTFDGGGLSSGDLLDAWPVLSRDERAEGFHLMPPADAEEVFLSLDARDQAELIQGLAANERRLWMRVLAPDDAADVIQRVPLEERDALLLLLDERTRAQVIALMAYAEDDAGGLMSPLFARVRSDMTADEAISYLRKQSRERVETLHSVYVLDAEQRLLGVLSLRELFAAPPRKLVREVMHTDVVKVSENADQEEVGQLLTRHHFMAIPVVDDDGRMKGVVTVDDIVDVIEEEATEDIQKYGGMEALEQPYLQAGFMTMVRKRGGWLAILFLGEMLTATAMGRYEDDIARAVVLALFVPLIISSGGNSGSQASTLVVRALALNEVRLRDWWRVLRRELVSGFCLGAMLGVLGVVRVMGAEAAFHSYGDHAWLLAATVGLSLVGVVTFGTTVGSTLPFLLRRLGLDPASASAPFVATLVDVTGVLIYFTVAQMLLSEMVS